MPTAMLQDPHHSVITHPSQKSKLKLREVTWASTFTMLANGRSGTHAHPVPYFTSINSCQCLSPQTMMMVELHWQHLNTRAFLNAYGADNLKNQLTLRKAGLSSSWSYHQGTHWDPVGQNRQDQLRAINTSAGGSISTETRHTERTSQHRVLREQACGLTGVQARNEGKVSEYVHRRLVRIQAELAKPGLKSSQGSGERWGSEDRKWHTEVCETGQGWNQSENLSDILETVAQSPRLVINP